MTARHSPLFTLRPGQSGLGIYTSQRDAAASGFTPRKGTRPTTPTLPADMPSTSGLKTFTFICGCGHSGTSLLANMFASHSDIFIPLRETNCFIDQEKIDTTWNSLLQEARLSLRSHFAEKTPRHIHCINYIRDRVNGAKFVLLVRDGRDVAASFIKRFGNATAGFERWVVDNTIAVTQEAMSDTIVVRYEDLIEEPQTILDRICTFCGIPFEREMLEYYKTPRLWFGQKEVRKGSGSQSAGQHEALRNWQINQPIFDGRGV